MFDENLKLEMVLIRFGSKIMRMRIGLFFWKTRMKFVEEAAHVPRAVCLKPRVTSSNFVSFS
jgi:hypothetical protein